MLPILNDKDKDKNKIKIKTYNKSFCLIGRDFDTPAPSDSLIIVHYKILLLTYTYARHDKVESWGRDMAAMNEYP